MNPFHRIASQPAIASMVLIAALGILTAGCGPDKLSEAKIIQRLKPSMVRIQGMYAGGSGVVVDAKRGLILTNAHVALDYGLTGAKARVGDDPSTETAVQLVAAAPCEDIAVMRLVQKPTGLKAVQFGDSSKVKPGDHVTVLGYPGSFQEAGAGENVQQAQQVVENDGTVSEVNVAATPDPGLPRYAETIEHQAHVNHGDSGGPLVDDHGRVVGMNTLGNVEAQGQYYAISSDRIRESLASLESGKSLANVGWSLLPLSETNLADIFRIEFGRADIGRSVQQYLDDHQIDGLYVDATIPGSPADKANLTFGDLITALDGTPVATVADACDIVQAKRPGDKLQVEGLYLNSNDDQLLERWTTTLTVR